MEPTRIAYIRHTSPFVSVARHPSTMPPVPSATVHTLRSAQAVDEHEADSTPAEVAR